MTYIDYEVGSCGSSTYIDHTRGYGGTVTYTEYNGPYSPTHYLVRCPSKHIIAMCAHVYDMWAGVNPIDRPEALITPTPVGILRQRSRADYDTRMRVVW